MAFSNKYQMRTSCPTPFFLFLVFSLLLGSCGETPTVDLFSIQTIQPSIIEPGDVITIEGSGFVEGRAKVVLDGTIKPIGLAPETPFHLVLMGNALSETKIEIPVSAYTMDTMTRETVRFSGVASVSFPDIQLESAVSLVGKSPPQQLEFRPTGGGVKIHALKIREAQQTMRAVGMELNTGDSEDAITITGVLSGSISENLGILPGCKLISVDHFPLMGIDELAGLEMEKPHLFEFVFPEGTSRQIWFNPTHQDIETDEFVAILLTSTVLGLFLAFIVPSWRRQTSVQRFIPAKSVFILPGYGAAALLTVLFPAIVIQWQLNLSGTIILLAIVVVCNAILLFYSPSPLLVRSGHTAGSILGVVAAILMGGAAGNTIGLFDSALAQASSLIGFHVWKNPLIMAATLFSISLLWPLSMPKSHSLGLTVIAWLHTISGALAIVFFCLGGWSIPGVSHHASQSGIMSLIGAVLIVFAKTWIVLTAARHLAGVDFFDRRNQGQLPQTISVSQHLRHPLRWIPLILLAIGAIHLELSPMNLELHFAGQVIATGIFCTLFSLFLFSKIFSKSLPDLRLGQ